MDDRRFTNALIDEESPYLQQHAHNPLQWYPWGDEARKRALREDKLIFLSIGYSTCHWCHVMERESFEDEEIATMINEHFVSIKVDREEMPHIDKYYQDLFYLLNKRGGGWPLSVVLTPDFKPFFAATYIPSSPKYGQPGIKQVFHMLNDAYKNRHDEVIKSADSIERAMQSRSVSAAKESVTLDDGVIVSLKNRVVELYDKEQGGFGGAPKFPHASLLELILESYPLVQDEELLAIALDTLDKMAQSGIYDQIESGFYRYSVDEMWLIPHFEKMLYTNAEMLNAYQQAYKITGKESYRRIVDELIDFSKKRFLDGGVFYSASDADSDGEEGKYFVFDYQDAYDELKEAGIKEAEEVLRYFGITKEGNFENRTSNPQLVGETLDRELLQKAKTALFANRSKKNYPFVDTKILTSWNALFIAALFESGEQAYATEALDCLLADLYIEGDLFHQKMPMSKPTKAGLFEDHAFLIAALIAGYQHTDNDSYMVKAQTLLAQAVENFYNDGRWYLSDDAFRSVAEIDDNAYKSALSVMICNLFYLAAFCEEPEYHAVANRTMESVSKMLSSYPFAYAWAVKAYLIRKHGVIVIKTSELKEAQEKFNGVYPFVFFKHSTEPVHQACKIDSCFAYDESLDELMRKVTDQL
jgi:uncharacterized protein YyaL (SSP411 family)